MFALLDVAMTHKIGDKHKIIGESHDGIDDSQEIIP
jgi:hypothetical protein